MFASKRAVLVGWAVFAAQVLVVLAIAVKVHRAAPRQVFVDEIVGPARERFRITEEKRRVYFQELTAGEPADQAQVRREFKETQIWNRNYDSFFHQRERSRLASVGSRRGLAMWQVYLILDEGFRNHWPPAPGVELRNDDAPLVRFTRPLAARSLIAASPPR